MEKKNNNSGKSTNFDVDKSKSSLVISYQSNDNKKNVLVGKESESKSESKKEKSVKKASETSTSNKKESLVKKENKETKKNIENKSETKKTKETKKKKIKDEEIDTPIFDDDEDESFEEFRSVKKIFNKQASLLVSIGAKVLSNFTKRLNKKLFKGKGKLESSKKEEIEVQEEVQEELKEVVFSINALIDMNVIFTDNQKKALYQPIKKGFYSQSDEILNKATISKIVDVFHETARKLKKVPVPDKGVYNSIPLNEVLANISEDEIIKFLNYVRKFPSKYIGQNYRISESFAAWVMSGAPNE